MSIKTGQPALASDVLNTFKSFSTYYLSTSEHIISFCSDVIGAYCQVVGGATILRFEGVELPVQTRTITADWAQADRCLSACLIGAYLYAVLLDDGTATARVYRYDKTNLAAGGTVMTTSGQAIGTTKGDWLMVADSNGAVYMTGKAGGSASNHIISKYTISGTVLTWVSNTTCGSTSTNFERLLKVDASGNFYGWNYSVDNIPRKYNSSGTLVTTYIGTTGDCSMCLADMVFIVYGVLPESLYTKVNL
jgi:hypothetical protein